MVTSSVCSLLFAPFYVIGKHQPCDIIVARLVGAVYGDIFPFVSRIETGYYPWELLHGSSGLLPSLSRFVPQLGMAVRRKHITYSEK
jgi:hypothetical protein